MILIKNATIHDGLGNLLEAHDLLLDQGKIARVGKGLAAEGAEVIDAKGRHVLPGFIDPISAWGATGPGMSDNDLKECDPCSPDLDVTYAFDHDGMTFNRSWRYGVTSAGVSPDPGNIFGGMGAVYKTNGDHPYKMLVKEKAFMMASVSRAVKDTYGAKGVPPATAMGTFAIFERALRSARDYKPEMGYEPKAMALAPVLSGEMPLVVNCIKANELDSVLRVLREFPEVRLVVSGAYGLLPRHFEAPCLKGAIMGDYISAWSNPFGDKKDCGRDVGRLLEQGHVISAGCGGDMLALGQESLFWNGLLWYKKGVEAETVISMLTSFPAKLLGVDNRIGAIAQGMDADVTLWSDHPIKTFAARLEGVWLEGRPLPLEDEVKSCW